jgi:hypothetical protein
VNRRGVCYDVGRVMWGQDWRPEFSPEEARRELQIIRGDLHCNAVRICGQDVGRLLAAGRHYSLVKSSAGRIPAAATRSCIGPQVQALTFRSPLADTRRTLTRG